MIKLKLLITCSIFNCLKRKGRLSKCFSSSGDNTVPHSRGQSTLSYYLFLYLARIHSVFSSWIYLMNLFYKLSKERLQFKTGMQIFWKATDFFQPYASKHLGASFVPFALRLHTQHLPSPLTDYLIVIIMLFHTQYVFSLSLS